ncbi:MAG: flagellar motor protein MotB [Proteobacteria bacterium]|nr:flagellar motor protein MotB [Pseudomonadota bacterium]
MAEAKEGGAPLHGGTTIIKKIKKGGGHGHHGGAWKVAYADFVTAMMAFFLLLWLLNVTTKEQKQGIAEYFSPKETISVAKAGSGEGVMGGQTPDHEQSISQSAVPFDMIVTNPTAGDADKEGQEKYAEKGQAEFSEEQLDEVTKEAIAADVEEKEFQSAEDELKQAMQKVPELLQLQDSLLIDRTPEGLRIQLVDQEQRSMFNSGSADMEPYAKQLIATVTKVIAKMPNKIAVAGHTDATPYRAGATYTNWELSADRANACRRELLANGLPPERIARVSGRADRELLMADDPKSPRNRRISILLLREHKAKP